MVTNLELDQDPKNCGNCQKMRVVGKRVKNIVAKCVRGVLMERAFIINSPNKNKLPGSWQMAKGCQFFDSMVDDNNSFSAGLEGQSKWDQIIQNHLN